MASDNIQFRKARLDDLDILLEFEQSLINVERPIDPTVRKDHTNYYDLKKMLADPEMEILVAEDMGRIIGCGYATIRNAKPYLQHKQYAYFGFMYVIPEYRGRGINAMIIEKLKEFARSKKITELRLNVYDKNEAAIKAYQKCGFEKNMIEMRMCL